MTSPNWRNVRTHFGFYLTAALLVVALLLGGSGTRPFWVMTIELLSAVVLAYFAARAGDGPARYSWVPLLILLAILLVPLLQLIPLGWESWASLPGRGLAAQMLDLAGQAGRAMPASLTPEATRESALAILPGAAMLLAALHLSAAERIRLVKIVIGVALFSAALGAVQYASDGAGTLFATSHRGLPIGLFSNRNHQADLLLVALVLIAGLWGPKLLDRARNGESASRWLVAGVVATLAVAVVATTSRTGLLLLPFALLIAALSVLRVQGRHSAIAVLAALGIVAIGVPMLAQNPVVSRTLDRYDQSGDDQRYGYWADTIYGIPQYLPYGAGIGSFVPVYQTVESLDNVDAGKANHAHNEYLEIALETGYVGWALLLPFLAFFAWSAIRLTRLPGTGEAVLARAALGGIAILLLHSTVDYPLRMPALAAVMGLLCALALVRTREQAER